MKPVKNRQTRVSAIYKDLPGLTHSLPPFARAVFVFLCGDTVLSFTQSQTQEEFVKVMISKLAALAAGLALFGGMALAQDQAAPPAGGPRMHGGMHLGWAAPEFGMWMHSLSLTDEQKAQISKIFETEKPVMRQLRKQEMAAQLQMMQLVTSGSFDQTRASAMAAQQSQIDMQLKLESAKVGSEIFETVLTQEQKAKVTQMIAQHAARMQQLQQKNAEGAQPAQ